jgi:hypothetical protein
MGPAEVGVDIRKGLGENGKLLLIGVANVKEVELHSRIEEEQVREQRGIRVLHEAAVPGEESGVNLEGQSMSVRQPHQVVEHVILELPKGPHLLAAETLGDLFIAFQDRL